MPIRALAGLVALASLGVPWVTGPPRTLAIPSAAFGAASFGAALDPDTIALPPSVARAIETGTRTRDGRPGPRYWQQRVDYEIHARLDPASKRLTGWERVTYANASPDTLQRLALHLYQNLFREGAERTRFVPITGGVTVDSVWAEAGEPLATRERGTLLEVALPEPLPPGGQVVFHTAWSFTVPPAGAPRTGADSSVIQAAQWYPQVAVYDDLNGWDESPYLGNGEFYLEYGTFAYDVTVPPGYLVAGSGTLQNPEEVLHPDVLTRLRSLGSTDDVVHVVDRAALRAGRVTREGRLGFLTWRFTAENVRDVAFAVSDRYLWDATTAVTDTATGQRVPIHVVFRAEADGWSAAWRMTKQAVEYNSARWLPYPYPQMTSSEGPIYGMEYPMLVFISERREGEPLYGVISHEVGHMWFPMIVGSNESDYGWMDEGVNTFITTFATEDYYPETIDRAMNRISYVAFARVGEEHPLMQRPDLIPAGFAYNIAAYAKPNVVLFMLRAVLGDDVFDRTLREYVRDWAFKHPGPYDFFAAFERGSGQDLDWFWRSWFFETDVLDLALVDVAQEAGSSGRLARVTVRNEGAAIAPIDLVLMTGDEEVRRVVVPASIWFDGRRETVVEVDVPGEVTAAVLDPELDFPDVELSNNELKLSP